MHDKQMPLGDAFRIAGYENPLLASYVRNLVMREGRRVGFARRFLQTVEKEELPSKAISLEFKKSYEYESHRFLELEEIWNQALDQAYAKEDGDFLEKIRRNIPKKNVIEVSQKEFNPTVISRAHSLIAQRNIPVVHSLKSNSVWCDILGNPQFHGIVVPTPKVENLTHGEVGDMFGMKLFTDAFRMPGHRVVASGEMFFFGPREQVGTIVDTKMEPTITILEAARKRELLHVWELSPDYVRIGDLNYDCISMLKISR